VIVVFALSALLELEGRRRGGSRRPARYFGFKLFLDDRSYASVVLERRIDGR
jgi:hypothetical protein